MIHLDTNYLIGLLIKIATVNQADFKPFLPHGLNLPLYRSLRTAPPQRSANAPMRRPEQLRRKS